MERKCTLYCGNIRGGLCAIYCVDKMYCLFIQDCKLFFISLISRDLRRDLKFNIGMANENSLLLLYSLWHLEQL